VRPASLLDALDLGFYGGAGADADDRSTAHESTG
jgi:hypothetical protein